MKQLHISRKPYRWVILAGSQYVLPPFIKRCIVARWDDVYEMESRGSHEPGALTVLHPQLQHLHTNVILLIYFASSV